jgi:hypothetical protein
MAAKREAALAAERLARDARLDARRQKIPAAVSSDGPLEPIEHPAKAELSVGSSSVLSGTEPERNEDVPETSPPLNADSSSGGGTATAPPVEQSATTEASATPSLTSLVNPISSVSGGQSARSDRTSDSSASALLQGRGVLDTESVSQFLGHKRDRRIFVSACADCDIFDEDLSSSLLKFHPVYDPLRDDDP